jgi:3-oxoacyl-[acyl-carrier protein] reductase
VDALTNRVALVTGGSRGIGKAVALALGAAGVTVAVNYRERADEAKAVVERIVRDVEDDLGSIDILINNAGVAITRGLDDITEEDFDRTVAVNLKAAFLCTQAVIPGMRSRKWGPIVSVSSIGARIGAGSVSVAYGAAKAGLEGLTRAYTLRLAADGLTANAVAPGLVRRRRAHSASTSGNRRRDRGRSSAAGSQRLHHGADDRRQRWVVVLLISVKSCAILQRLFDR